MFFPTKLCHVTSLHEKQLTNKTIDILENN